MTKKRKIEALGVIKTRFIENAKYDGGLCVSATELISDNIEAYNWFEGFIVKYEPAKKRRDGYFFVPGSVYPRVRLIDRMIKDIKEGRER